MVRSAFLCHTGFNAGPGMARRTHARLITPYNRMPSRTADASFLPFLHPPPCLHLIFARLPSRASNTPFHRPRPLPPPLTQIYDTTSSLFIGFLDAACARAAAKAAGGAGGVAGGPQQQKNKGQGSDGKYQGE